MTVNENSSRGDTETGQKVSLPKEDLSKGRTLGRKRGGGVKIKVVTTVVY